MPFSLFANISIVFKCKLSQLIYSERKMQHVHRFCLIATHMHFSQLVFYLSDCRLQSLQIGSLGEKCKRT